jgi:hypothetical protein
MSSPEELRKDLLLSQYVSSFEKLNEMSDSPSIYPFVGALAVGTPSDTGDVAWRPRRTSPDPVLLESLYGKLPAKFPSLFERLLLTFRWAEVSLDRYSLMANPLGPNFDGFVREISKDPGLWESLIPAGYLRFGKGPDMDYDPVCFDMNSRKKSREMRVVKIDHEEILCNYRVKVVAELAPSFEALVLQTIEAANKKL